MKNIVAFLIFCLILFFYLHIFYHIKTSDDLEIYEIDEPSKEKLEEICDLRQPVIFDLDNNYLLENCSFDSMHASHSAFDLRVRNVNDDNNEEMYIPLTLEATKKLFDSDNESIYFTEKNSDFLEETGLVKHYKYHDEFFRPYLVSNCNYDVIAGSSDTTTPLRYSLNYRNYYIATQGDVTIKLTPPCNKKYLYQIKDYDNFEFRSAINPWNPDPKYTADMNKMKFLEITLKKGQVVFIPAYWWYSIKFGENSSLISLKYKTYMNNIAISPEIFMHMLQNQNIKHQIVKKMESINLSKKSEEVPVINSDKVPVDDGKKDDL